MKIRNIDLLKLGFLRNLQVEAKFTLSYKKNVYVNCKIFLFLFLEVYYVFINDSDEFKVT